jgi:hypothetical protein
MLPATSATPGCTPLPGARPLSGTDDNTSAVSPVPSAMIQAAAAVLPHKDSYSDGFHREIYPLLLEDAGQGSKTGQRKRSTAAKIARSINRPTAP